MKGPGRPAKRPRGSGSARAGFVALWVGTAEGIEQNPEVSETPAASVTLYRQLLCTNSYGVPL